MEDINVDALDLSADMPMVEMPKETKSKKKAQVQAPGAVQSKPAIVNCLRNEKVIVQHINKQTGLVTNPKHILYGGMAERAVRIFTVPMTPSGRYKQILTEEERECLEDALNLPYNSLNPYSLEDNFWDDTNDKGINQVRLTKQPVTLNLSNPEDYIKYKILLANSNLIAPSLSALQTTPKASYQFVLVSEGEETQVAKSNMSTTMQCYKEFGKIEDDANKLRFIIESIEGRPLSVKTKLDYLQTKVNDLITSNNKLFLKVVKDPLFDFKVVLKQGVERGVVTNRGGYFYLKSTNQALCEAGTDPTIDAAAKYLSSPKNQEILFTIQAKIKE
jgi:hypothetical protein